MMPLNASLKLANICVHESTKQKHFICMLSMAGTAAYLKHCCMSEVYESHIETTQQYLQNALVLGVCSPLPELLALQFETISCICGPSNGKQS